MVIIQRIEVDKAEDRGGQVVLCLIPCLCRFMEETFMSSSNSSNYPLPISQGPPPAGYSWVIGLYSLVQLHTLAISLRCLCMVEVDLPDLGGPASGYSYEL